MKYIAQRILTKQLRELEANGIINRIVYPEVPPRVEYELTEEGKTLEPILIALKQWGDQYASALIQKRNS